MQNPKKIKQLVLHRFPHNIEKGSASSFNNVFAILTRLFDYIFP